MIVAGAVATSFEVLYQWHKWSILHPCPSMRFSAALNYGKKHACLVCLLCTIHNNFQLSTTMTHMDGCLLIIALLLPQCTLIILQVSEWRTASKSAAGRACCRHTWYDKKYACYANICIPNPQPSADLRQHKCLFLHFVPQTHKHTHTHIHTQAHSPGVEACTSLCPREAPDLRRSTRLAAGTAPSSPSSSSLPPPGSPPMPMATTAAAAELRATSVAVERWGRMTATMCLDLQPSQHAPWYSCAPHTCPRPAQLLPASNSLVPPEWTREE